MPLLVEGCETSAQQRLKFYVKQVGRKPIQFDIGDYQLGFAPEILGSLRD